MGRERGGKQKEMHSPKEERTRDGLKAKKHAMKRDFGQTNWRDLRFLLMMMSRTDRSKQSRCESRPPSCIDC